MHDATLAAMDKVVFPGIEMAVKSSNGSSEEGLNSEVQNPDRQSFLRNAVNTPLVSASSRLNLNTNQVRNDETLNKENFEDGDSLELRPNCDRRAEADHMVTGHNVPHNSNPEYLTGQIQTRNDPLPQQLTKPQNMASLFSRDNTFPMGKHSPQKQNSDSGNPINKLAEAIGGLASQQRQRPQTLLAFLYQTTTNPIIFDGKNEKIETFEYLFRRCSKGNVKG